MLDFYQWFPMDRFVEVVVRVVAFLGLVSIIIATRKERREYADMQRFLYLIEDNTFTKMFGDNAVEAMVLSFRINGITLYSDYVAWYNRYMGCARRGGNFFVYTS